jgi:hypothetical protein
MSRKKRTKNGNTAGPARPSPPDETYGRVLYWCLAVALAIAFMGVGVWWAQRPVEAPRITQLVEDKAVLPAPTYVGRAACVECHAEQDRLWQTRIPCSAISTT